MVRMERVKEGRQGVLASMQMSSGGEKNKDEVRVVRGCRDTFHVEFSKRVWLATMTTLKVLLMMMSAPGRSDKYYLIH